MKRIIPVAVFCVGLALLFIARVSAGDPPKPAAIQADRIIVFKKDRKLELLRGDTVLRTYRVSLGTHPIGPKERQGDHKTPEGNYVIDRRNPRSRFYLALHISYPNDNDRKRAATGRFDPGGDIMIHGLPNGFGWVSSSQRMMDWTDGCIAVTDKEIEEIWSLVPDGTPIEIRP
ncbi:MAG: L,D-transpeptidase family protein [Terriglobales bacterium]